MAPNTNTNTNPSNEPNYLTFASNRPRAPLLKPAALRPEGSTVLKARSMTTAAVPVTGSSSSIIIHKAVAPYKRPTSSQSQSQSQPQQTTTATSSTASTTTPTPAPPPPLSSPSAAGPDSTTSSSTSSVWLRTSAGHLVTPPTGNNSESAISTGGATDSPFFRSPQSPRLPTSPPTAFKLAAGGAASTTTKTSSVIPPPASHSSPSSSAVAAATITSGHHSLDSSLSSIRTTTTSSSSTGTRIVSVSATTSADLSASSTLLPHSNVFGKMLPRSAWTPDSLVEQCQYTGCSSTFAPLHRPSAGTGEQQQNSNSTSHFFGGFTSLIAHPFQARRHHCRACGKVFCSTHSGNSLPLYSSSSTSASSSATTSAAGHLKAPATLPVTPGAVSPVSGAFPFSILRRGSNSGTTSPAAATESSQASMDQSHAPLDQVGTSSSVETSGPIVQARVCDECFISLQLSSSLEGMNRNQTTQGLRCDSPKNVGTSLGPSLTGATTPTSPSAAAPPHLESDGINTITTHKQGNQPVTTKATGDHFANLANKKQQSRASAAVLRANVHKTEKSPIVQSGSRKPVHPLDPRHALVSSLAAGSDDSGGSNPDGSLAASLGTTPAVGWTWSTF